MRDLARNGGALATTVNHYENGADAMRVLPRASNDALRPQAAHSWMKMVLAAWSCVLN